MNGWKRWLPGLQILSRYEAAWLPRDLMAGLVLTTMLVPVGIAYAVASGVPGIYGQLFKRAANGKHLVAKATLKLVELVIPGLIWTPMYRRSRLLKKMRDSALLTDAIGLQLCCVHRVENAYAGRLA